MSTDGDLQAENSTNVSGYTEYTAKSVIVSVR